VIDFKLDPKSGIPFYRQIIDQIRFGIARGNLKVGEQLPTVRALAVQLQINLNTISKGKNNRVQEPLSGRQQ
jgi:GntR family transcriptional regulator